MHCAMKGAAFHAAIALSLTAGWNNAFADGCFTDPPTATIQCLKAPASKAGRGTGPVEAVPRSPTAPCPPSSACQRSGLVRTVSLPAGTARISSTFDPRGGTSVVATNSGPRLTQLSGFGLASSTRLAQFEGAAAECIAGTTLTGVVEVWEAGEWHSREFATPCGSTITVR